MIVGDGFKLLNRGVVGARAIRRRDDCGCVKKVGYLCILSKMWLS